MLITEVTLKKEQLTQVEKKLNLCKLFFGLFSCTTLVSLAHLIYCIVTHVSGYDSYLFSGGALLGSVAYLVVTGLDYRHFGLLYGDIVANGEAVLRSYFNVNLKRKTSGSVFVNWTCFVIVLVCLVIVTATQIISFNPAGLSSVVLCLTFLVVTLYLSLNATIIDRLYKECVLGKRN